MKRLMSALVNGHEIRLASGPKIRLASECLPAKEGCRSKYAPEGYGEKASEAFLS